MGKRKKPGGPEPEGETPPPPPSRPTAGRSGVPLYARIDAELARAFQRYLKATRPRPTRTAAIELALENLLREAGFWPPPDHSTAP